MDCITVEDLEVLARVGVPEAERARPQRLLLTLLLGLDVSAAARTEDLARTVDYAAVAKEVREWLAAREWKLIETIAVQVAERLLAAHARRGVVRVVVEVKKFILPGTRHVAVRVERPARVG